MEARLERFKGIHPGLILDRELRKRHIKPSPFALSLDIQKQNFSAIINGKRGMSIGLALKVEKALGMEEGTFALLQTYYDIEQAKKAYIQPSPDLKLIRKVLFWDTDIEQIDWQKQYKAVIQRIFERGNEREKQEISRFYGDDKIQDALSAKCSQSMVLHTRK